MRRFKPRRRKVIETVRIQLISCDVYSPDLNYVPMPTGEFDVWVNGVFRGRFDKSEEGLIELWQMARSEK